MVDISLRYGQHMVNIWLVDGYHMGDISLRYGQYMVNIWLIDG